MTYHQPTPACRPSANGVDTGVHGPGSNESESEDNDTDPLDLQGELSEYYWGYEVRNAMRLEGVDATDPRRLRRFKLLLDRSKVTQQLREQMEPVVSRLHEDGVISGLRETDIIADFLERLFRHTRDQMVRRQYRDGDPVEFALCIPAIWTRKACRIMQAAMTAALHRTGFITTKYHDAGESFVLLDAGGGTVDAITYKVASMLPLRLEREAVPPRGSLCGSSYLNEAFEELVRSRLEGENYLSSIKRKIDRILDEFENNTKRTFDLSNHRWRGIVEIDGLRENKNKNFKADMMIIDRHDMGRVFKRCLDGVSRLMIDQLEEAEQKSIFVTKLILIGGFAASPTLIDHVHTELNKYSEEKNRAVQLILPPSFPGTAVASGAVLRALRKEDAPTRTTFCSYGLVRDEPYDGENDAHAEQRWVCAKDRHDGRSYIRDTIFWFLNRGDSLESGWEHTISVAYTFALNEKQFLCEEELCVSDRSHRSHYQQKHRENEGRIVVDMTELRDKGLIEPVKPGRRSGGKEHYLVEFDLVIAMDGLNLRVEARYPRGSTGEECVKQRGRICISAAFLEQG
ncbi:hypothetical protein BDW59DRAFT_169739 [Aspergillus cavernicola]|uniref:Actin-like ATPase domain-containing protein n=1 Tax=Aspergillus cavernicola TaxID=176166 RepID=A0ABR4IV74_9EURO